MSSNAPPPWGQSAGQTAQVEALSREKLNQPQAKSRFQKAREEKEKKQKQEEAEAALIYGDFVKSFDADPSQTASEGASFVRAGDGPKEAYHFDKSKPLLKTEQSKLVDETKKQSELKLPPAPNAEAAAQSGRTAPKQRQIDELLSEIKTRQEQDISSIIPKTSSLPLVTDSKGSFDTGDPSTTNLFISNLAPSVTEELLTQICLEFGAIESVKIMWPRSEEEKMRKKNCGFVSFVKRVDASAALQDLHESMLEGYRLSVCWGKAVSKQTAGGNAISVVRPAALDTIPSADEANPNNVLVVLPSDETVRRKIDLLAKYVCANGEAFESHLQSNAALLALDACLIQSITDNASTLGVYYRWRVYAYAMGDDEVWRETAFQMLTGGPLWVPPRCAKSKKRDRSPSDAYVGMTGAQIEKARNLEKHRLLCLLEEGDYQDFSDMLQCICPSNESVRNAMGFVFQHVDSSQEIIEMIKDSFFMHTSTLAGLVAKLYLLSDVLYNSGSTIKNASVYRNMIQATLPCLFDYLNDVYRSIGGRMTAKVVENRVLNLLKVWDSWSIFPGSYIAGLEACFKKTEADVARIASIASALSEEDLKPEKDALYRQAKFHGVAVTDRDATPLGLCEVKAKLGFVDEYIAKRVLLNAGPDDGMSEVMSTEVTDAIDDDVDGEPMEDDIDGVPLDDDIDGDPFD